MKYKEEVDVAHYRGAVMIITSILTASTVGYLTLRAINNPYANQGAEVLRNLIIIMLLINIPIVYIYTHWCAHLRRRLK